MSQSELNNKLKNKLEDYSSDIDQDLLWAAIENDVPQKKKRRGIFWIWGFAGLFGVIVAAFSFWNGGKSSANTTSELMQESEPNSSSILVDSGSAKNFTSGEKPLEVNATLGEGERKAGILGEENTSSLTDKASQVSSISKKVDDVQESDEIVSKRSTFISNSNNEREIINEQLKNEFSSEHPQKSELAHKTSDNYVRSIENTSSLPLLLEPLSQIKRQLPRLGVTKTRDKRRSKKIKPNKKPSHFLQAAYNAGGFNAEQQLSEDNRADLNDGTEYFAQGLDLKYGHYITPHIYATVGLNYDVKYKNLRASISRDTIVPSSNGEQVLSTNIYVDGAIDNLSGIPEVLATVNRSVNRLNEFRNLNIIVGLGYQQKWNKIRVHAEGQIAKSIYSDRAGLAILNEKQRISDLKSFADLYASNGGYLGRIEVGIDMPITRGVKFIAGGQYEKNLSNQISAQRGVEKQTSLRGTVGIRLALK